jgi:dipeptidyl aminopeptidase/acylaminoacyl peptidase
MRLPLVFAVASTLLAQSPAKRPLGLDDLALMQDVGDPQLSPDGKWIAYTVGTVDKEADKRVTHLWMVSWDGKQDLQITNGAEGESDPHWSPDGQYISFLSDRAGKAKGTQLWVLDRRGGEARQFTAIDRKQKITDYAWSPDSKRLAFVMRESDEPDPDAPKAPNTPAKAAPPIVIDRYHFKQDIDGYLAGAKYARIYLYDVQSGKAEPLTTFKKFDEAEPAWSPDGQHIAFVSNQDEDADRSENSDVWVSDAMPGSSPKRLTTFQGFDGGRPAWSPDSKLIAYLQGTDPKYSAYQVNRVAIVPAAGGAARLLSEKHDRGAAQPLFTNDGKKIVALVADDQSEYPAAMSVADGTVERLAGGSLVVMSQTRSGGHAAVLAAFDGSNPEVFAMEGGSLRKLTAHNDALFAQLRLGEVRDIQFKSKDGTEVHGLLTVPPGYDKTKKYPTLLRIHGGPNGQDAHSFAFERQIFAANGYAVINVNYRGSSGRGMQYSQSIFADWGNREVADLLASVDHVLSMGVADPERLGIGGWSYGGILTDYTIATDTRFKAAIAGAGSANQISMYGADQYTLQYDTELGAPWKNPEAWVKISYPFFQANRIKTPTLFMGGDQDFNVPIIGSEQMYQALRSLGVPTELVIYPGQHHGIARPSYQRDRLVRYLAWYAKYLK